MMIDLDEKENQCIEKCLVPLGEIVAEIGMDKPLSAYTKEQILTVIKTVVSNYQNFMIKSR